jgi:predicted RNA methylase
MPIQLDPEDTEIIALLDYAGDLAGKRVLEIGCGDGRLTWRYAGRAAQVIAIDSDADEIKIALEDCPPKLRGRVEFQATDIETFDAQEPFDIAILSWSL